MRGRHAVWLAAAFALAACDGVAGGDPLADARTRVDDGRYTLVELDGFAPDRPEWPYVVRNMGHMLVSSCTEGSTSTSLLLTGATAEVTGDRLRVTLDKEEACSPTGGGRPRRDRTPTVIEGRIGPMIITNWDDHNSPPDPSDPPPSGGRSFSVIADDGREMFRGGARDGRLDMAWVGGEITTSMILQRD